MAQPWELILLGDPGVLTPAWLQALTQTLAHANAHIRLRRPSSAEALTAPGPRDLILLLSDPDHPDPAPVDWRAQLHAHGWSYQVVWGQGDNSLHSALLAMAAHAHALGEDALPLRAPPPVRWHGVCESCGDADCEHQLFGRLLQGV